MTIEASINTWVQLALSQNKKIEDFEVHQHKNADQENEIYNIEKPSSPES